MSWNNKGSIEKRLERRLCGLVEKMGGWAVKLWPMSISGLPDRLVLMPNRKVYFAEIKDEGKQPTKVQKYIHAKLEKLGFPVWVINSDGILFDFIQHLKQNN